jgi:hypothetical protein
MAINAAANSTTRTAYGVRFFGGIALENDGSLAFYTSKELKEYLRELACH